MSDNNPSKDDRDPEIKLEPIEYLDSDRSSNKRPASPASDIYSDDEEVFNEDIEITDNIRPAIPLDRTMSKKFATANFKTLRKMEASRNVTYDASKNISIRVFDDTRPKKDVDYFIKTPNYGSSDRAKNLAVVIPFFNEKSEALQQTLNSLHETWNYLRLGSKKWQNCKLLVCLIQDGWNRASPSMKEYLKAMFPKKITVETGDTLDLAIDDRYSERRKKLRIKSGKQNEKKNWWDYYEDFDSDNKKTAELPDRTFIFQKKNYGPVKINPQENLGNEYSNRFMNITLIIKTKNRRKHNSHEWFLGKSGFAESVNPEYVYLTDAFTLYNKWMLYHLVKSLDENRDMIGVTGRQRLMSKEQQGSDESFFSLSTIYRNVQLYDFESSNVIYNGAFSLGGLLPVIPGPSGLYRANNILDDNVREFYFETVNKDPDETGMVLGNLRIAEDRILSYAAVTKSANPAAYVEFNPLAIFYFEAETDLDSFIFQRRRWINGSVAGYFYLLFFSFSHFKNWKANPFRKFYIWLLLMCQLITYMLVGIAPSITLRIFYHGINYFIGFFDIKVNLDLLYIGIAVWVMYLIHVGVHHKWSKYNYFIMHILLFLLSFAVTIMSIASLILYTFIDKNMSVLDIITCKNPVVYLAFYVSLGVPLASLLLSGRGHSFLFMLKAIIPYYLFLPMQISWFGSYAYARLWDLSWGNRPASEMDAVSANKKEKITKDFKRKNLIIIVVLVVANIILYTFVPLNVQLILITIFFGLASYQLTLSIIYFLIKIFYKISFMCKKCRISNKREMEIMNSV